MQEVPYTSSQDDDELLLHELFPFFLPSYLVENVASISDGE